MVALPMSVVQVVEEVPVLVVHFFITFTNL
jgi:hypothetical protein